MIISNISDRLSHDRVVIAVMLTVGHSSRPIRPAEVGARRATAAIGSLALSELSILLNSHASVRVARRRLIALPPIYAFCGIC